MLQRIRDLTGNVLGEAGLITFAESNWLMSIVVPHQPHFLSQPEGVSVLWGYGLFVDAPGNFVEKPMAACTGREIMTELLGHLRLDEQAEALLASFTCIPCMMPFITSQFLARRDGDRSRCTARHGQSCFRRTVLRVAGRRRVYRRILNPQRANGRRGAARSRPTAARGRHETTRPTGAVPDIHDAARCLNKACRTAGATPAGRIGKRPRPARVLDLNQVVPLLEHPGAAHERFHRPQPLSASSYSRSPNPT